MSYSILPHKIGIRQLGTAENPANSFPARLLAEHRPVVHFRHAAPGLQFRFGTASGVPPRGRGARRHHSPTICPAAPAGVPPGTWDDFPATQGPGSPGPEPDGQSPKARHRATPHPQGPGHCATSPVDAGQPDQTELQFLPDTLVTTGFPGPSNRAAGGRRRPGVPPTTRGHGRIPVRHRRPEPRHGEPAQPSRSPSDGKLPGQGPSGKPGRSTPRANRQGRTARLTGTWTPTRSKTPAASQPGNRSCSGWGPDTTFIHILPGPCRRYPCSAPENRTRHPAPERRTDQPAAAEGPKEKTRQPIPI